MKSIKLHVFQIQIEKFKGMEVKSKYKVTNSQNSV